jgi:hypothetical protein
MSDNVRLVLDIATNRVVYFTQSLDEKLHLNEFVITYEYAYSLPANLTLSNCWNFRLVGNKLIESVETPRSKSTTEFNFNRSVFLEQINQTFERYRNIVISESGYSEIRYSETQSSDPNKLILNGYASLHGISLEEADQQTKLQRLEYVRLMNNIEYLREQYLMLAKIAVNNNQIMVVYGEFLKRTNFLTLKKTKETDHLALIGSVDISKMAELVDQESADFLLNTNRQTMLKEQADTETIVLFGAATENMLTNTQRWHSESISTNEQNCKKFSIIVEFLKAFAKENNAELKRASIIKLAAGGVVLPHPDYGGYYVDKDRYHLVLSGAYTYVVHDDSIIRAKPGDLFWFDNKLEHYSINTSDKPRISIIFDIQPNNPANFRSKFGADIMLPQLQRDPVYVANKIANSS